MKALTIIIATLSSGFLFSQNTFRLSIEGCYLKCDTVILLELDPWCISNKGLDTVSNFTEDLYTGTFHEERYIIDFENREVSLVGLFEKPLERNDQEEKELTTVLEFEKFFSISQTNKLTEIDCNDTVRSISYYTISPMETWNFYNDEKQLIRNEKY